MKAKNILMTLLLVTGAIAAKAAGYPPELALVSQPVMVYNDYSITVYYDVENIGDYTYRGNVYLYLDPDNGYYYGHEYVRVRPGSIKRIAVDIPAHRINRGYAFTIMPYYELNGELYSFTTFEYFEPITFFWDGPRNERWVVINIGPCPRYYHRPGTYRYYYDGFRPPMPPAGREPRPMDPKHHTYSYHHDNGGYPATHFNGSEGPKTNGGNTPAPNGNSFNGNNNASVRPTPGTNGSMSHGNSGTATPNTGGSNSNVKPNTGNTNSGSTSGRTPSSGSNVNRPSSTSRPSGTTSGTSTGRTGSSSSSNSRVGSSSSTSRPNGTTSSSSSSRSGSSSVNRSSASSSNSGNSGTRTSSGSSTSSSRSNTSSSSSSTRSGANTRGR